MNKSEIEKSLKQLVFELFGHSDLKQMQYFKLKEYLELFMAVEDHFSIVIPLKSIKGLLSFEALVEDIHKKVAAKNAMTFYPF